MEYEDNISSIIGKRLEAALNDFGELLWAYVVLSKKDISCIFGVTNYPSEWVKKYQEKGLQYIDPVVITARNRLTPFAWDENLMVGAGLHFPELFDQAREFGVTNGYTFVLHDYNDNLVTLSFSLNCERKAEIMQALIENKGDITILLASVHETYLALASLSEKNVADLEKNARFTDRENEILYWASVGKTYQETGMILGIKTGTIKFHMSNIVKKLGVANARHAIRLGMELQLIKPVC
ncbi:LuxR family transcriptional regulator [Serratia plymuthica]|uniref:LuxR family transcriptional regulator n=1 Tax=Serratia plymuthica TaxID=82996 RepID=UPI0002A41F7C|nr:LuxR family transcriptional regulator [Serratia plymuthica]AHY05481.1 LuxR family transcriptional regulator [Serratia plymuthica]ANJ93055.1 LuxR family transcriptional regulator [Serratia plymuthica]EKF66442.1 transcriptional activator protein [Serratia plymuthica A30]MBI6138460.1 LuxR family transcriptional regulator [Serratia plymuthica]MBL3525894.1 LuxR family transcriptional regulator [Serratia plymuthica]